MNYNNNLTDEEHHKLDQIDQIEDSQLFNEDSFIILQQLSQDNDAEIRYRVAETLINFPSQASENILLAMLYDSDELVRVNACDSLQFSSNPEVIEKLKLKVRKERTMVRGYAVLTIANIAINAKIPVDPIIVFLVDCLKREKSQWVKIYYYEALLKLGNHEYYKSILEQLNNRYYRNRCAAINSLSRLVNNSTKEATKVALNNRLKAEQAYSVESSIMNLLKQIDSID